MGLELGNGDFDWGMGIEIGDWGFGFVIGIWDRYLDWDCIFQGYLGYFRIV